MLTYYLKFLNLDYCVYINYILNNFPRLHEQYIIDDQIHLIFTPAYP